MTLRVNEERLAELATEPRLEVLQTMKNEGIFGLMNECPPQSLVCWYSGGALIESQ